MTPAILRMWCEALPPNGAYFRWIFRFYNTQTELDQTVHHTYPPSI